MEGTENKLQFDDAKGGIVAIEEVKKVLTEAQAHLEDGNLKGATDSMYAVKFGVEAICKKVSKLYEATKG